jgi:hypothetical protein
MLLIFFVFRHVIFLFCFFPFSCYASVQDFETASKQFPVHAHRFSTSLPFFVDFFVLLSSNVDLLLVALFIVCKRLFLFFSNFDQSFYI